MWRIILPVFLLLLSGCATNPLKKGAAVGFKELNVWIAEGDIQIKGNDGWKKMNFTWTQRDDHFTLDLRSGKEQKNFAIRYEGEPGKIASVGPMTTADDVSNGPDVPASRLKATLPVAWLSTWLLGQANMHDAIIKKGKHNEIIKLEEGGWKVNYKEWQMSADYRVPEEITIKGHGTKIKIHLIRAETAFVDGCCEGEEIVVEEKVTDALKDSWAAMTSEERKGIDAPEPLWVSDEAFRAQLIKLHGKIPDPKIGLYGPDSMMWQILKYVVPPGLGAGRALVLQVAHPWVTIGINEHSKVKMDPLERGRRTFRSITAMVFGSLPQAMAAADHVRREHDKISGTMKYDAGAFKEGTRYNANEINAMIWVHTTLWETVIHMYEQIERPLTHAEKERFYEETKLFAMLFGIPLEALPKDWDAFMAYNRDMWASDQLKATPETKELMKYLFEPKSVFLILPMWVQEVFTAANLPPRLQEEMGMKNGWFRSLMYEGMVFGAKVADRLLIKSLRYNPGYNQGMARINGEKSGYIPRKLLRIGVGAEDIVN